MRELKVYKMVDKYYCDDSFCVEPSDVYLKSEVDEAIAELKDVIRKHEEKNKWRSPIDEKPERGQLVLVAFSERQKMHYFPIDVVRWNSSHELGEYEVNAWMPLPQPPKEAKE